MSRLIMRRGPNPGKVFDLTNDVVTIGSGLKNAIVIQDNDVSREHCRLIRVMADYEVHDLNSARGTFVSGQRVKSGWVLRSGNVIELGETITLEYERGSSDSEMRQADAQINPTPQAGPRPTLPPALVVTSGYRPGETFVLRAPKLTIGRDPSNDIIIQDAEVSRYHAVLRANGSGYEIEDLGSTNGSMVNGIPLEKGVPRLLNANDLVILAANITLRYTWQPEEVRQEVHGKTGKVLSRPSTNELMQLDTAESKLLSSRGKRQTSKLGTGLAPGSLLDHVFVAYSRSDWSSMVVPIMALLQDSGFKVWVDQYLVQGGDDWMAAVEQALSECWLLVVIVTPEALESRYVRLAYRYFFNREKPTVPFIYTGADELPVELKKISAIRYNAENSRQSFEQLVSQLRVLRNSQS